MGIKLAKTQYRGTEIIVFFLFVYRIIFERMRSEWLIIIMCVFLDYPYKSNGFTIYMPSQMTYSF